MPSVFCVAVVEYKVVVLGPGQEAERQIEKGQSAGLDQHVPALQRRLYCGAVRPALPGHSRLHFEAKHQTMSAYLSVLVRRVSVSLPLCGCCCRIGHQEVKKLLAGQINLYRIYRRPQKASDRDCYLLDWRGITEGMIWAYDDEVGVNISMKQ